jgi:hypothetical protein
MFYGGLYLYCDQLGDDNPETEQDGLDLKL